MTITIEHGSGTFEKDGHTFSWWLELHVSAPDFDHKSTQLGGSPPDGLANRLAAELIQEGAKK